MANPEQGGALQGEVPIRVKEQIEETRERLGMGYGKEEIGANLEVLVQFLEKNPNSAEADQISSALEDYWRAEGEKRSVLLRDMAGKTKVEEESRAETWRRGEAAKERIDGLAKGLLPKQ